MAEKDYVSTSPLFYGAPVCRCKDAPSCCQQNRKGLGGGVGGVKRAKGNFTDLA